MSAISAVNMVAPVPVATVTGSICKRGIVGGGVAAQNANNRLRQIARMAPAHGQVQRNEDRGVSRRSETDPRQATARQINEPMPIAKAC